MICVTLYLQPTDTDVLHAVAHTLDLLREGATEVACHKMIAQVRADNPSWVVNDVSIFLP